MVLLPCLVALLALVSSNGVLSSCDRGWREFRQSCYKVVTGKPVTHPQAESLCRRAGGHLASINTPAENNFVQRIAHRGGKHNWDGQPWIGLVKLEDGRWHWTDRSRGNGFKWAPREPNNAGGNEKCGQLMSDVHVTLNVRYHNKVGVINDMRCSLKNTRYVCEKKAKKTRTKARRTLVKAEGCRSRFTRPSAKTRPAARNNLRRGRLGGCGPGWKQFKNSCYKVVSGERVTHPQAEKICRRMGGHLASINTRAENNFLQRISHLGRTLDIDGQPWIGLFKKNGKWQWTDGSRGNGYRWAPGEPNNSIGHENCGQLMADQYIDPKTYRGQVGVVNDHTCYFKNRRFICERSAGKPGTNNRRQPRPAARSTQRKGRLSCTSGWRLFGNSCYKVVSGRPVSHPQAERLCKRGGGHLASINTRAENNFLQRISHIGGRHSFNNLPWIGLVKRHNRWQWVDRSRGNGFKWAPGEPNNHLKNEFCGQLVSERFSNGRVFKGRVGVVNDHPCAFKSRRFICEKKAGRSRTNTRRATSRRVQAPKIKCPSDAIRTRRGCKCKPGNIDILDTNFPEKGKYKRGMMCIPNDPCHHVTEKLTVLFVVDSSGSIGDDWNHVLNFLKKAASLIPKSSRVGFVKFATKVTAAKWLKNGWTERDFIAGIPAKFDKGFTNTGAAFNKAAQMLKNDRNERKVVILVTDGVPESLHDSPAKAIALANDAAKKLRASGDTILALGIGEKIKKGAALLKKWVVDQDKDYFAYHQAISMLSGTHMRNVMKRVCDTPSLHQLVKHRG